MQAVHILYVTRDYASFTSAYVHWEGISATGAAMKSAGVERSRSRGAATLPVWVRRMLHPGRINTYFERGGGHSWPIRHAAWTLKGKDAKRDRFCAAFGKVFQISSIGFKKAHAEAQGSRRKEER